MSFVTFVELFGAPLLAVLFVSVSAPLVGVFLRARGTAFHGIVLPQLATLGIAVGHAVHPVLESMHGHESVADAHEFGRTAMMVWAGTFVALGTTLMGARSSEGDDVGANGARAAALFAAAGGLIIIAKQVAPLGGLHVDTILAGETLAVTGLDVVLVAAVSLLTTLVIRTRWRRMTLAGQDPDFAVVIGVSPKEESIALGVLTCLVVMTGTLTIGALPLFGLLVLPAWALHGIARSMASTLVLAPVLAVLGSALGIWLGFVLDVPLGASVVTGLALVCLLPMIRARAA